MIDPIDTAYHDLAEARARIEAARKALRAAPQDGEVRRALVRMGRIAAELEQGVAEQAQVAGR